MNVAHVLPARRRWIRYSLRTLFVLVTLVCVYLGWAMNWIRQRREFLNRHDVTSYISYVSYAYSSNRAPAPLRLLGEEGIGLLFFSGSDEEMKEAERLFPEAKVSRSGAPY